MSLNEGKRKAEDALKDDNATDADREPKPPRSKDAETTAAKSDPPDESASMRGDLINTLADVASKARPSTAGTVC